MDFAQLSSASQNSVVGLVNCNVVEVDGHVHVIVAGTRTNVLLGSCVHRQNTLVKGFQDISLALLSTIQGNRETWIHILFAISTSILVDFNDDSVFLTFTTSKCHVAIGRATRTDISHSSRIHDGGFRTSCQGRRSIGRRTHNRSNNFIGCFGNLFLGRFSDLLGFGHRAGLFAWHRCCSCVRSRISALAARLTGSLRFVLGFRGAGSRRTVCIVLRLFLWRILISFCRVRAGCRRWRGCLGGFRCCVTDIARCNFRAVISKRSQRNQLRHGHRHREDCCEKTLLGLLLHRKISSLSLVRCLDIIFDPLRFRVMQHKVTI